MCLLCCQWFCHFTVNVQNLLMPKKCVSPVVSRSVICVIASLTKYLSKEGKLWKKSFCVPDSGKPSFDLVHLIDLLAIIIIFTWYIFGSSQCKIRNWYERFIQYSAMINQTQISLKHTIGSRMNWPNFVLTRPCAWLGVGVVGSAIEQMCWKLEPTVWRIGSQQWRISLDFSQHSLCATPPGGTIF